MLLVPLAAVAISHQALTAPSLTAIARKAVTAAVEKFKDKKVAEDQLGVTIAFLDRPAKSTVTGSFRGDQSMYPASVVKLFFLAYAADQLEAKKLKLTPEFERGLKDMIVESSNDATALVLDTITGTTGGPELPERELKAWMDKRQVVNRWYAAMGYPKINACAKTWNEAPYGRERQGYGPNFELRNSLSPDACVRLMSEIALDKLARCDWMRGYLGRKIGEEGDYQSKAFTGGVVPKGTKLFSKAGYTDTVRHDVAYLVAPDGREFVLAIFTKGQSGVEDLIPFIASEILRSLRVLPQAP